VKRPEARTVRIAELSLAADPDAFPALLCLLQRGFSLELRVGVTLNELLCGQLGLAPDYVSGSISTVFLNGRPVDDLDAAIVEDGATVALSGAMPGLLGAVMRSGSVLASFRGSISHRGGGAVRESEAGRVRFKLFNMVMRELGPGLLQRGILVETALLAECLASWQETGAGAGEVVAPAVFRSASLDGREMAFERLLDRETFADADLVRLTVESGG
jgi:hypothetical protein